MKKTFRTVKALGDQFDVDKFGRGEAMVATDDVWGLSRIHVKPAAAATLYISSSNEAADTDIFVTVEYIDANGAQQTATGQLDDTDARTFVSLGVTGLFVNRAYLSGDGESLTGNVYVSNLNTDAGGDGIPDNLNNALAFIPAADGQTMQAIYMVPDEINGKAIAGLHLSHWWVRGNGNTANSKAQIQLKQLPPSGSWRTVESVGITPAGPYGSDWPKTRFYPAGTVLKLTCLTSTNIVDISGGFCGEHI